MPEWSSQIGECSGNWVGETLCPAHAIWLPAGVKQGSFKLLAFLFNMQATSPTKKFTELPQRKKENSWSNWLTDTGLVIKMEVGLMRVSYALTPHCSLRCSTQPWSDGKQPLANRTFWMLYKHYSEERKHGSPCIRNISEIYNLTFWPTCVSDDPSDEERVLNVRVWPGCQDPAALPLHHNRFVYIDLNTQSWMKMTHCFLSLSPLLLLCLVAMATQMHTASRGLKKDKLWPCRLLLRQRRQEAKWQKRNN